MNWCSAHGIRSQEYQSILSQLSQKGATLDTFFNHFPIDSLSGSANNPDNHLRYVKHCIEKLKSLRLNNGLLGNFLAGIEAYTASGASEPFRIVGLGMTKLVGRTRKWMESEAKAAEDRRAKEVGAAAKSARQTETEAAQREKAARAAAVAATAVKAPAEGASDGLARKRVNGGCFSSFCRLITGCLGGLAAEKSERKKGKAAKKAAPSRVSVPPRGWHFVSSLSCCPQSLARRRTSESPAPVARDSTFAGVNPMHT